MELEEWVGQQVSVYLDDAGGSRETKAIGVLGLVDDRGVVVEEDDEVIAFYPWRFIQAIKMGEPEEPTRRRRSIRGPRRTQIEDPEEGPRSGPRGLQDQVVGPQGRAAGLKAPEDQEGVEGVWTYLLSTKCTISHVG